MNTEQLNAEYSIPGQLKFIQGGGGLPFIEVSTANSSALISVYAGQVLSFRQVGEVEPDVSQ